MQDGTEEHEKMEYRVHKEFFASYSVKCCAKGIKYSADKKQPDACRLDAFPKLTEGEDDAPAHCDISYHRQYLEFFYVDGVEDDSEHGAAPYASKKHPTDNSPHGNQCVLGIRARD